MTDFVYEFLDLGESVHKDVRLVKAPIELVRCDDSIASDEGQIKKAALGDLTKGCYPAFLLGIWHYVVVNRKDNSIGKPAMMNGAQRMAVVRETTQAIWANALQLTSGHIFWSPRMWNR